MKTYLFDFDGTLVDSMPVFCRCMLRILDEEGISYEKDIIKTLTPLGLSGTIAYFMSLGVKSSQDEILRRVQLYLLDAYENDISGKNHVQETLEALKGRGYSLNVLTASPHVTLDPCLKRLGLTELFDNIWSCDDFCTTKANPQIYKLAAQRLGVQPEDVLFLDDNLDAVLTAKSAGMQTCGVYDPSSEEYVQQMKATADHYIYDMKELLQM